MSFQTQVKAIYVLVDLLYMGIGNDVFQYLFQWLITSVKTVEQLNQLPVSLRLFYEKQVTPGNQSGIPSQSFSNLARTSSKKYL